MMVMSRRFRGERGVARREARREAVLEKLSLAVDLEVLFTV
jgi:hypothetical protein